ncbi:hypothetical protein IWX91DRAFT_207981 [Phyllosticta citricarpa]
MQGVVGYRLNFLTSFFHFIFSRLLSVAFIPSLATRPFLCMPPKLSTTRSSSVLLCFSQSLSRWRLLSNLHSIICISVHLSLL